MSDVQAPPAAPVAPATEAPPPHPTTPLPNEVRAPVDASPPAEPTTVDARYVEQLRKENAAWRTRTQEYEQRFGGLDGDTMESLADFADLLRSGDSQAATSWLIESSRVLAGDQWPALVARYGQQGAAQVVAQVAAEETPTNPLGQQPQGQLTREVLLEILDERDRAAAEATEARETQQRVQQLQQQYNGELHTLQIHPDSGLGRMVKMQAIQMTRETGTLTSMTDALAALRQIAGQALGVAIPASPASPVAPAAGVPGQQADTRTTRQRIMERLESAQQAGVARQA